MARRSQATARPTLAASRRVGPGSHRAERSSERASTGGDCRRSTAMSSFTSGTSTVLGTIWSIFGGDFCGAGSTFDVAKTNLKAPRLSGPFARRSPRRTRHRRRRGLRLRSRCASYGSPVRKRRLCNFQLVSAPRKRPWHRGIGFCMYIARARGGTGRSSGVLTP